MLLNAIKTFNRIGRAFFRINRKEDKIFKAEVDLR